MRILITGKTGLVGRALERVGKRDYPNLDLHFISSAECDLRDANACRELVQQPFDAVIHAAAKVGGISANIDDPVGFLAENIVINTNIITACHEAGIERFLFLGSSCMYPRDFPNALVESDILTAPLEPTNEGYALTKIVGAKHCEYITNTTSKFYKTMIPCNLYGPDDHFGSVASHLVAAAVTKVVDAIDDDINEVDIWGDGSARREFLYSDDLADFLLSSISRFEDFPSILNVGSGVDHSVNDYYQMIADVAGFEGTFTHDLSKPVGMKQKLMSSEKANGLGWNPPTLMREGLKLAVDDYRQRKHGRSS